VASKSLVKWLKMLWENWGMCVVCQIFSVVFCLFSAVREFAFLL
jgi:hypothetical protein